MAHWYTDNEEEQPTPWTYSPQSLRAALLQDPDRWELTMLWQGNPMDAQGEEILPRIRFTKGVYNPPGTKDHPREPLDLSQMDFSGSIWEPGADLSRVEASHSKWNSSKLKQVIFVQANLSQGEFIIARLDRADLRGAILKHCSFNSGSMRQATLARFQDQHGTWHIVQAQSSSWVNWDFQKADLTGVDFTDATFQNCQFQDANLTGALLRNATLRACSFDCANLEGADFTNVDTTGGRSTFRLARTTDTIGWPITQHE